MFTPIPKILEELQAGRMIVLVDDENRENEGDLVVAAQKATPEVINFMATYGRGLICLAMTPEKCDRLGLNLMAPQNDSKFGTAFTASIDAAQGVTSGVSAQDRAHTILTAVDDDCGIEDLASPGHIFPLRARRGGVLVRAGQTEGSVDLARLAGMRPAGVICEIMNPDGTMARVPQLIEFCRKHDLKLASVADIIEFRRQRERLIEKVVDVNMPTEYGEFRLHCYRSRIDEYLHLALTCGDVGQGSVHDDDPVLVRVHSECLTGDIFHSLRCDCGLQLEGAMQRIAKEGTGVVLYIRQEGRGIGLINKLKAYALQEQGLDTVEANTRLGLPADLREYGIGAQILIDLGIRKLSLLTNNPKKIRGISGYGLKVVDQIPIEVPPTPHNRRYLRAKRDKMGHLFQEINEAIND
ncbi:MAG TPA: bifunctional 3,4-dihydroxy-2-butanone-4-phosphate synthase/GTP cyclohydrolase II [Acidobacteriota bacterium]|nr:bifunctional 3,4-dihydroxy-2-butanone-4-phosphate synthase/GTP cyclohydrolase II [Acidobacteriota bacterium]